MIDITPSATPDAIGATPTVFVGSLSADRRAECDDHTVSWASAGVLAAALVAGP